MNSETRYATARQFVLKESLFNKLQPYENTVNYKRKSRRRFFLLVRSRTPPICSEFRGGGLNTPNPPSRYATVQEYGHQQMSRGFTVYMVFVSDFLNAENKITLIQRQTHNHHEQANVICKCTLLCAG